MKPRFATMLLALLASTGAGAQSELPSAVSAISVAPSMVAAEVSLAGVTGSATLVVAAVEAGSEVVLVVLEGAAHGSRVVLELSHEVVVSLALAVGDVIVASATAGGWLLLAGGEVLAFVPNAAARALIHHRELW